MRLRLLAMLATLAGCGDGRPELVAAGHPCRPFEPRVYIPQNGNTFECICFVDGCVWSWCRAGDFTTSPERCR